MRGKTFCANTLIQCSVLIFLLCLIQCSETPTEPVVNQQKMQEIQEEILSIVSSTCEDGYHLSGAKYRICMPVPWSTGDLVIYAHGYRNPYDSELKIPEDEIEGIPISVTINSLGYAYATTSYRRNGLAINDAVEDLKETTVIFNEVVNNWASYETAIKQAITSHPFKTKQLLRVTKATVYSRDPESILNTVTGILWYNIFATNNAIDQLGGQPFDNSRRIYFGSYNDFLLNRKVQRFKATPAAIAEIEAKYQTSGALQNPLVTIHTTGDEIVPYWHVPLYRLKVFQHGSDLNHTNIPVFRYGHCNFKIGEVLAAFAILVFRVSMRELIAVDKLFPSQESKSLFLNLSNKNGTRPIIITRSK